MNRQLKRRNGKLVSRGIEWTDYTWNPVAGCLHHCRWQMPDGTTAICYAEAVAQGVAQSAYPQGFEHPYFHPARLDEPLKVPVSSRIFLDSMSDLMGWWTPQEQIEAVLQTVRAAHWHTFQLLTKNAPRLLKFQFPSNLRVGVSSPPDYMYGRRLSRKSQEAMLRKALRVLSQIKPPVITWMSFEPLSWDVSGIVAQYPDALDWCVIGAATNGRQKFQPNPQHVENLLNILHTQGVPVFFKGNLRWQPWREEFPDEY